jgi:subfamily B ATP-binding cassette protein MsbA
MKRLIPYLIYLRPVRWKFILALICAVIYGISSGFGLPFMASKVFPILFSSEGAVDLVLLRGEWNGIQLPDWVIPAQFVLAFTVTLLPLAFIIRGASGYLNTFLINYCGIYVLQEIRKHVFGKLQSLSLGFYQKHKSGDLMSRLLGDTTAVQTILVNVSNDLIKQPISFLGAVGALIYLALQQKEMVFIILCLGVIPLFVLPIRMVGKRLNVRAAQINRMNGELMASVGECLQSPREIQAYNQQPAQINRFSHSLDLIFRIQMKLVKYAHLLTPLIEIISAIGVSIAIFYAARSGVKTDSVIALIMALYFSYDPIKKIGNINSSIQTAFASLDRIEYILNYPEPLVQLEHPVELGKIEGAVRFEQVSFAYNEEPVLVDLSLVFAKGDVVALVGPSGSGKTTFTNLIPRFFDPVTGNIFIDQCNLRDLSLTDLRNQIAIVSQDPILFNDTVLNNLLIGRPDATESEVRKAAEYAMADEFIQEMPEGYQTLVGERGTRLSGGQKQRLAIARAFLKNAPILILDEATSALDSESEAKIQGALEKLVSGKTTFIIAHRFSSIRFANRILVFEHGRIVGDGSHEVVYRDCPLYRRLYNEQMTALPSL